MKKEPSAGNGPKARTFPGVTRRQMLRVLGAGTLGAGLIPGLPVFMSGPSSRASGMDEQPPPPPPSNRDGPAIRPFPLRDVELLDSPFKKAQERDAEYMLSLDPDRLLHNFRANAGLEPRAPVYGGWESQEPWIEIRCHGHTLGHWLTAGSLMFASTGREGFRKRVGYMVEELQACQKAGGTGLISAFPDGGEQIERAVRGERFEGVPWYTLHKILAGLRDAHVLTGNGTALQVMTGLADWAWKVTAPMSEEAFQTMLRREHGGMNEVLADLYSLTGEDRYLALARKFCDRALLNPLAAGEDTLDGLHANTQIPKVIGFQRLFELTGEEEYRDAALFFWERVVTHRSFATGGHGDVEHFFPADDFPRHLESAKTMETCCTYNMLRLTRMLFGTAPSAALADYYELALYNGILASQDPDSGWNTYFQPTRPGYLKLYHTPIDSFWCCTGSGMENHAKYGDSIYFRGEETLFVNLFIPSILNWKERQITVRQATRFPEDGLTRLEVTAETPTSFTMFLRYPSWAGEAQVTVNGAPVPVSASPGSFISVAREWHSGDTVELRLAMGLRAEPLPGAPNRVAFLYGPVVLAGRLGTDGLYTGADILRNERTYGMILDVPVEVPRLAATPEGAVQAIHQVEDAEPLTFRTRGIGRPREVTLIPYFRLHHERYNLYWEVE